MTQHWQLQPRQSGKFEPLNTVATNPKPVIFKLPYDLYELVEQQAIDQGISVNLFVRELVVKELSKGQAL